MLVYDGEAGVWVEEVGVDANLHARHEYLGQWITICDRCFLCEYCRRSDDRRFGRPASHETRGRRAPSCLEGS